MPKTQWAWYDSFSTFDFPMIKDENCGRKLLSRFVSSTSRLGSYNWPNMYPIMASQPSSQLNEETVLFYMNALQTRSGEYHRPTVVLVEMRHWHHCEKFYFVLDGHHKLEAMQRLSKHGSMRLKNNRLNFLIISRIDRCISETEKNYIYNGGLNQLSVMRLRTQDMRRMKRLQEKFEVACAVGHLVTEVTRDAHEELKKELNIKWPIIAKLRQVPNFKLEPSEYKWNPVFDMLN